MAKKKAKEICRTLNPFAIEISMHLGRVIAVKGFDEVTYEGYNVDGQKCLLHQTEKNKNSLHVYDVADAQLQSLMQIAGEAVQRLVEALEQKQTGKKVEPTKIVGWGMENGKITVKSVDQW